jgi:hypothetical protein
MPSERTASLVHPLTRYGFIVLDWSTDDSEAARLAREEEWLELQAQWYAELIGSYIIGLGTVPPVPPVPDDLVSITDAAARLHVSRHTLYKGVARSEIPTYKAAAHSHPKVKLAEVACWIAAHPRIHADEGG